MLAVDRNHALSTVPFYYTKLVEERMNRLILNLLRTSSVSPSLTIRPWKDFVTKTGSVEILVSLQAPQSLVTAVQTLPTSFVKMPAKELSAVKSAFVNFAVNIENEPHLSPKMKLEKFRQLLSFVIAFEQETLFSYLGYELRRVLHNKSNKAADGDKNMLESNQLSTNEIYSVIDVRNLDKTTICGTHLTDCFLVEEHFGGDALSRRWEQLHNISSFVFALFEKRSEKQVNRYTPFVIEGELLVKYGVPSQDPFFEQIPPTLLHPIRLREMQRMCERYLLSISSLGQGLGIGEHSICILGKRANDPVVSEELAHDLFSLRTLQGNWPEGVIEPETIATHFKQFFDGESSAELLYLYFELEKRACQLPVNTFHFLVESFDYDLEFSLARMREDNPNRKQKIFDFREFDKEISKKKLQEIVVSSFKIVQTFPTIKKYLFYVNLPDSSSPTVVLEIVEGQILLRKKFFWNQYTELHFSGLSPEKQSEVAVQLQQMRQAVEKREVESQWEKDFRLEETNLDDETSRDSLQAKKTDTKEESEWEEELGTEEGNKDVDETLGWEVVT